MADLTITATNVVAGENSVQKQALAGEAITAGQGIYIASATKKWMKADANSATAEARKATHIALNGAALNQPVIGHGKGLITIGATLTPGTDYYLSDTPGGICPRADIGSGEYVCQLGLAVSATQLDFDPKFPNVAL